MRSIGIVAERRRERLPNALVVATGVVIPLAIAIGLAASNDVKVVGVVLALLGALVILAWPFYGLIFFVGLLYTRPEESIPALAGMHFTLVISLVTLAGWLVGVWIKRTSMLKAPIVGMSIAFGLLAVVSAVPGSDLVGAAMDISHLVVLVVLIVNLVRNRDQFRSLVNAVIVFTAYLAGYSIYLYQHGAALMIHGYSRSRAGGIFADPNDLATTIGAGLAFVFFRMGRSRGFARAGCALLAGLCVWAITLTDSRSGLLSMLVVVVGWTLLASRNKRWAILVAASLAVVAVVLAPTRMTNFDTDEQSANSRFWFWSEGIDQLVAHPLFGVGYGRFPSVNSGMTAHNSFVLCFAELGLFAYFCWMGCLYYCFQRGRPARAPSEPEAEVDRINLLAGRLSLASYLTGSFWLSHTYSPILYLLIGLAASAGSISVGESVRPASADKLRDFARIAAISIASIIFIWALAIHYRSR